jgi:uncharacterized RDD family membrane protein YckC
MSYATFWQRFGAMWIDFFVLLPFIVLTGWAQSFSKAVAIGLLLPTSAFFLAYHIYCHGRYGQTIGKRVMGIRVSRLSGEPIGWREAWLRSSVDVVFAILGAVSSFIALMTISDADYYGIGWLQRAQNLAVCEPAWLNWSATASTIWVWSEIIVMLFNSQRRALHDFIAGTIVIQVDKVSSLEARPDEIVK